MGALDKHYRYSFKGTRIDPYRILKQYGISDPVQQHIIKKGLRAGEGAKSLEQDIDEIILSCNRWKEMLKEEGDQPKNSLEEGLRNSGMQHGGVIPPFRGEIIG